MLTTALLQIGNTFYFEWEVRLMEWLQSIFSSSLCVALFSAISSFGEELICIAIMGFLYWGYNKEIGKYIGTNVIVAIVANPFVKNIFVRRRPYLDNASIKLLKKIDKNADITDIAAQGYSFPSGHSTCSATTYGSLFLKTSVKWLKIVLIIIPLLVGISRFVLGAHYPTDVLVGWALGILVMALLPLLKKLINKEWLLYLVLTVVLGTGFFFCTSNDYFTGMGTMIGGFSAFLFEEKFVKFENTKVIWRCVIRTIVGGGLYMLLNTVLKLPFSKEFLESATMLAYIVRTVRYIVVVFVVVGIYPMLFKYTSKIGKKA